MILLNSGRGRVVLSVNSRKFDVSALKASSLTWNRRLRWGPHEPYAFLGIAVPRRLEIFFLLALTGCGFGVLRCEEGLLLEVLDRWPRADPAGENGVADKDNFTWLGCKGDEIDTKSSTAGDRFVGLWVGGAEFGTKVRAVGDRVEGFGFAGENIGTKVSADCDREEAPPADAEVDSVVDGGKLEERE